MDRQMQKRWDERMNEQVDDWLKEGIGLNKKNKKVIKETRNKYR